MPFVVGRRIVVSQDVVLEAAMASWLEELDRREAAAREEIAGLRDQIEELTRRLAEREDVLSRLQITRETMTEILSGGETVSVTGAEAEAEAGEAMATLAVVHDANPAVRRPHDIIASPGGRTTRRAPRKGPKARAKWLTASVEHDADQVIAGAFDEAQARDPQHRRCWVVLVDGAEHQLELIHAEAARRGVTVHVVLDIVHVIEKSWAASRCFHTATDPAAETWVGAQAARILAGDSPGAVTGIRPKPTGWACPQTSGPQPTGPAATWRTTPPISTTTRPSLPDGRSPAASSKEQHAIWWPTASISPAAGGPSPEPKLS
ncbi:hypothetical protein ACIPSJ_27350 [Streptomyces sp. NPDC090088]|uniref:hypothetical protein n=1 Tax=Streptomyces sp. NPDC090088 TaxID=3365944 RepID=UPI00382D36CD